MTTSARLAGRNPTATPASSNPTLPSSGSAREYAAFLLLAFFVTLMFLIPTRLVFPPLGSAGRPVVVVGCALLVLWLLTALVRGGLPAGRQPIRWMVLLYLVTQCLGFVAGYSRGLPTIESDAAERFMISTLALVGVTLCFADGPRNRRQVDLLLRVLVGFGAFAAMVGAAQFFVGFDLQSHVSIPGLRPNSPLLQVSDRGTGGVARVAGMTSHYIEFGVVLAVLAPLAIHVALYEQNPTRRLFRWGMVAVIVGGVPLSVSRSGMVTLAVGMLVLAVAWSWRMRYDALVLGILSLLLFRAINPGVLGTLRALFLSADRDPSVQGRIEDYDVVFPMILDRPVTGRGAGTFIPERYILLDNQVLNTLVSTGVVGLIGFLGLFVGGIALARSVRRRATADEDRHLAQALCASLAGCLIASVTFDSLSFVLFTAQFAVLLGTVGALWRLSGTDARLPAQTAVAPNGRVRPPLWPDLQWVRR